MVEYTFGLATGLIFVFFAESTYSMAKDDADPGASLFFGICLLTLILASIYVV